MKKPQQPAQFMLINSKGYPDFVMTMLVVIVLALLLVIMFWMGMNIIVVVDKMDGEYSAALSDFMNGFNENSQVIILGLCSSVFSLAGAYYLRRAAHDKNFMEREKSKLALPVSLAAGGGVLASIGGLVSNFVDNKESTLNHENYDDEEEDI